MTILGLKLVRGKLISLSLGDKEGWCSNHRTEARLVPTPFTIYVTLEKSFAFSEL